MALCTEAIALAPSPVAAATRFIELERTSPTANTPGMLVSHGRGRRPGPAPEAGPGRAEVAVVQLDVGPDEPIVPRSDPGQPARGGFGAYEAEQTRARL